MIDIFNIKDKVILFTGGYGYLGAPCVKYFASQGAKVYVLSRDESKFKAIFEGNEQEVFHVKCDISSTIDIRNSYSEINRREGRIDVLINNAFYSRGQSPEEMSDDDFLFGLDGTLRAIFSGIREIIPYFKNQKFGKIINVSSMYGVVAPDFDLYDESPSFLNPPHYGAGKAGIIQLTKYYASYLGKYNIQVNTLTPGPFPSVDVKQKDPDFEHRLAQKTLVNRVGLPEDLIGTFVLLSSEASNFITGQNIIVDGGWTCR